MIIIWAKKEELDEDITKKISLEDQIKIISEMKKRLKNNEVVQKMIKKSGYNLNIIDGINYKFSDEIDVSAKTINSEIFLNLKLLDESTEIMDRYAVHELVHAIQHMDPETAKRMHQAYDSNKYLDRPDEIEAFQWQNEFDAEQRGEEEVVDYVEDLLDYHDIPRNERQHKKKELLEKV